VANAAIKINTTKLLRSVEAMPAALLKMRCFM
jgi:hypothetical protein